MEKFEMTLTIETDGDFDFKNDDNYFEVGSEEYKKTIIVEKQDIESNIVLLFENMKERIFNRYNQKDYLINFIKELEPFKDTYNKNSVEKVNHVELLDIFGFVDYYYMNGNQTINLTIYKEKILQDFSIQELIEKLQKKGLRYGQIFENIRNQCKQDLFYISDENLKQELVKLLENKGNKVE